MKGRWFMPTALGFSLIGLLSRPALADTANATATMLGRELPIAIEAHQIDQLSAYFADDVRMTVNVPKGTEFKGKKWTLMAFQYNPLRTRPVVSNVIVSAKTIVVVQNIPSDRTQDRMELAPRVDTFHLNDEGKIALIESVIADRVMHRDGRY